MHLSMSKFSLFLFLLHLGLKLSAQVPHFHSHLFEKGTLVYSDDFDCAFDPERWEPRSGTRWEVREGLLIGRPSSCEFQEKHKEESDDHRGLGPVIRLNQVPENFVCHMRFKYEGEDYQASRPKVDIGHHINNLFFRKGGYSLKLSGGERFEDRQSGFELNEWVDLIIELREGKLLIELNGHQRFLEHEQVSMKSRDEFTFKALDGSSSRLVIDYVRLWRAE